jgi:hypothetical protein
MTPHLTPHVGFSPGILARFQRRLDVERLLGNGSHLFAYWAVSLTVLLLCALRAYRGHWVGDFFEHAAVVRELARHPWHPQHPLLVVQSTHAFFSPYHLALGLVCRWLGCSPFSALAVVGIVNLTLVFLFLHRLITRLSVGGHLAAPYALIFILVFWGSEAWSWSGFLHWVALPYVARYPSTFAAALTLLSLSLLLDTVRGPDWIRRAVPVVLTVALATALAIAWPHFSLLSLVATRSPDFDKETRPTLVAPPPWRCGGARKASPNVDWHLTDP